MADFCRGCSIEHLGRDFRDLADLCEPGQCVDVLCEGCGPTTVDHEGQRLDKPRLDDPPATSSTEAAPAWGF